MNSRTFRRGMVLFWFAAAVALFSREAWAAPEWLDRFRPENLTRGAWASLGLMLYSLVRLFMTPRGGRGSGTSFRDRLKARQRPEPKATGGEYNPELDFTKPADRAP